MAFCTESVAAADAPPPGVGFDTIRPSFPAEANCAAPTEAVSCVALVNCTLKGVPASVTVEAGVNPVPVTVIVVVAVPTKTAVGETVAVVGAGY
jgi:hypothetical protein